MMAERTATMPRKKPRSKQSVSHCLVIRAAVTARPNYWEFRICERFSRSHSSQVLQKADFACGTAQSWCRKTMNKAGINELQLRKHRNARDTD